MLSEINHSRSSSWTKKKALRVREKKSLVKNKVSNQNLSLSGFVCARMRRNTTSAISSSLRNKAILLFPRFDNGWGLLSGGKTSFVVASSFTSSLKSSSFANYYSHHHHHHHHHHRRSVVVVAKKRFTTTTTTTRRSKSPSHHHHSSLFRGFDEQWLRERWTVAYAVAVRDAFQAKTSKCEEEPALRAVLEVKEALEKETKKEEMKFKAITFALSSLASREMLMAELNVAQNEDEVTRVLNLAKRLADAGASSAHFARALAFEVLKANVPARAVEKSLIGEKLMRPEVRRYENDILWSITVPSEKIVLRREEIRNEMHRKGYVVIDGVLGEKNSKICEEAAMKFYESDPGTRKFKSGELAYEEKNDATTQKKEGKYRDDEIAWLTGDERPVALGALSQFLRDTLGDILCNVFNEKKDGSNKHLLLSPTDYHSDVMLSVYSSNRGGFVKHLDHDDASDPRKISAVYYLNSQWNENENRGALLLYPEGGEDSTPVRVNPIRDRLVLFWSDTMYHAVEPSEGRKRFACSFWYV